MPPYKTLAVEITKILSQKAAIPRVSRMLNPLATIPPLLVTNKPKKKTRANYSLVALRQVKVPGPITPSPMTDAATFWLYSKEIRRNRFYAVQ